MSNAEKRRAISVTLKAAREIVAPITQARIAVAHKTSKVCAACGDTIYEFGGRAVDADGEEHVCKT